MTEVSVRAVIGPLLRLAAIPKDDWEDSLQQILQIDSEVLGLQRVSYWSLQRASPALIQCEMGYIAEPHGYERGSILLKSDYPSYFAELNRATVVEVVDARRDPRTRELHDYLVVRDIWSMLDVPVWTGGEPVGVLCHEHAGAVRQWTNSDLDFAVAAAQAVASALEARARSAAQQDERRASFLDRCSRQLAELAVSDVVQRAVSNAVPELATWAALDLLEGDAFQRAAIAHETARGLLVLEEMCRRFPPRLGAAHLSARVVELRQSVLLPDVSEAQMISAGLSPEHARMVSALGTRAALCVPLCVNNRVLGTLQLCANKPRYTQGDLRLCEEYAQRVAVALDNARLHEQVQQAVRARDEFIALAAHELHSPLASLQLAAESLAARAVRSPPETVARMSDTIVRQTQRLTRLVDHMLDASRIMAKRLVLTLEQTDLSRLLRELMRNFAEVAERAGCRLELLIEDGVVGCWDGDRLSQLVTSLLDNAIKFGAGKPITIELRNEDDVALLAIRDRGIGIPAARIASIFDPFVRAVSPRNFGGLGLGLFTAKAIVDAHHGEISVQSKPNEGATFTIRLPRHPPAPAPEPEPERDRGAS